MLDFLHIGKVALVTLLSLVITLPSLTTAQASLGYVPNEYDWDEPAKISAPAVLPSAPPAEAASTRVTYKVAASNRGVQWKDEQKAHWEYELNKYYRRYLGNEDSLPQAVDQINAKAKSARFFDLVRSWDPHKGMIPWNSSTGSRFETDVVTVNFKEIVGELCTIGYSVKTSLSPEGRAAARLWNSAFPTMSGGTGSIRIVARGQDGFDKELNRLCGEAGISNCSDEVKDAIKSSAHNITENEKSESVEVSREVKNKSRFKWRIEPLIYANIDLSVKSVDLTPHIPGQPNPNPDPDDPSKVPPGPYRDALLANSKILLQPGTGRYGYQHTATDMLGIGGGAGLHTVVDMSGPAASFFRQLGFVAGGMIILNRIQTVSRKVPSLKVMAPDYVFKHPSAENISKYWSVDDSFSYMGSGGIMLTFGVTYAAVVVGPTFISEVSEQKIVTKIAPTKVMVEIADINLNSGSVTIGSGPISYSNIVANQLNKARKTYLFDLSFEAGRRSFEQMMIGNYYDAQALIALGNTVAVVELSREINKSNSDSGGSSIFMFGLPFLYKVWMKDNQSSQGKIEDYANHIDTKYDHGIFVDREERRLIVNPISPFTSLWYNLTGRKTEAIEFNSHKYLTKAFYGGIEKIFNYDDDDQANRNYYGRAVWNFQFDHSKKSNLKESIDEMIYMDTGLEELDVDDARIPWDLGYLNIEVLMDLNKNATDALMNLLEGGSTEFIRELERIVDDYFTPEYMSRVNAYGDYYYDHDENRDYCHEKLKLFYQARQDARRNTVVTIGEAKKRCKKLVLAENKETIQKMVEYLTHMRSVIMSQDDDKKEFARLYREFGKLMISNRFTYRTVYNLLVKAEIGDFVRYTLNGERVANLGMSLPSARMPVNSARKRMR